MEQDYFDNSLCPRQQTHSLAPPGNICMQPRWKQTRSWFHEIHRRCISAEGRWLLSILPMLCSFDSGQNGAMQRLHSSSTNGRGHVGIWSDGNSETMCTSFFLMFIIGPNCVCASRRHNEREMCMKKINTCLYGLWMHMGWRVCIGCVFVCVCLEELCKATRGTLNQRHILWCCRVTVLKQTNSLIILFYFTAC